MGESAWPQEVATSSWKSKGKAAEGAGWNMGRVGFAYEGWSWGLVYLNTSATGWGIRRWDLPPTGK